LGTISPIQIVLDQSHYPHRELIEGEISSRRRLIPQVLNRVRPRPLNERRYSCSRYCCSTPFEFLLRLGFGYLQNGLRSSHILSFRFLFRIRTIENCFGPKKHPPQPSHISANDYKRPAYEYYSGQQFADNYCDRHTVNIVARNKQGGDRNRQYRTEQIHPSHLPMKISC